MSDFQDERIIKLKEQANKEYKDMQLQIANIEEMIKMFHDAVLAFNCTSLRYAEVLSRLLAESEQTIIPTFDAPRETVTDNGSGEIRGQEGRPTTEQLPPLAHNPEVL